MMDFKIIKSGSKKHIHAEKSMCIKMFMTALLMLGLIDLQHHTQE